MSFHQYKNLLLLSFFAVLCLKTNAQNKIKIDEKFLETSLLNHIEIADDNKKHYNVEELDNASFKTITKPRMGRSDGDYWLRFSLQNTTNTSKDLYLVFKEFTVTKFNIYKKENNKPISSIFKLKNTLEDRNRSRVNTIDQLVKLAPNTTNYFYINVHFPRNITLDVEVNSTNSFLKNNLHKAVKNSLYYGITIIISLLNLLLFFNLKDKTYLYYGLFVFSVGFFFFNIDGSAYNVLGEYVSLAFLETLAYLCFGLFSNLFTFHFLDIKNNFPKIYRFLIIWILISFSFQIIYGISNNYNHYEIANYMGLLYFIIEIICSLLIFKTNENARYFAIAYGTYTLLTIASLVSYDTGFVASVNFKDLNKLFSVLEILIITLYMAQQFKKAKDNAETNKLQLLENTELEKIRKQTYASLTHEIKTPLTLIKGYNKELTNNQTANSLQTIDKQLEDIDGLINTLINLNKDEITLHKKWINISEFLNTIYTEFSPLYKTADVLFEFTDNNINKSIFIDEKLFYRCIANLLTNSLKFTKPKGKVVLNCNTTQDAIEIQVIDNGIGISKKDLTSVFKQYYQANNTITQKTGSGIGLFFTDNIIQKHEFSIDVKSIENAETTFTVTIPNKHTQTIKEQQTYIQKENKKTVLVVDDNESMRKFIRTILEQYNIVEASNGKEALNILDKHTIDCLITDYHMPIMGGDTMIKTIKDLGYTFPLFVITSDVLSETKIDFLRLGIDYFFIKPFYKNELLLAVNKALDNHQNLIQNRDKFKDIEEDHLFEKNLKNILNKHYKDPDFSVEYMANSLNISTKTLIRKTKITYGQTPNQLILETRLKNAQLILNNSPEITFRQLTTDVGLKNASYLKKRFKERFNLN